MGDIPDWFWQSLVANIFTEGLMLAALLAWKYRSKLHEHYVYMLLLLTGILASVTIPYRNEELVQVVEHSDELEELPVPLPNFMPKVDPLPQFRMTFDIDLFAEIARNSIRNSLNMDLMAEVVRNGIRDSLNTDLMAEVVRRSVWHSIKVDQYAAESARNSFRVHNDTSLLARTAEEVRKSFMTNHDMGSLARTAEEVRKSFNAI